MTFRELAKQQLKELIDDFKKFGLYEVKNESELSDKVEYLYNHCNCISDYRISDIDNNFVDILYGNLEVSVCVDSTGFHLCKYVTFWGNDDDTEEEFTLEELQ